MTIQTNAAPEELADEGVKAGVEQEETEHFSAHEPFDPASISISSKVVALDTVLRRIRNSTIKLAPSFQRNYVWDDQRKSLLIESMMLRIPLPMFYVSEDKDGVWEVVDGLQRLTTIRDFILGQDDDGKGFALKGLEFWGELFNGKMFFDIERKMSVPRIINNIMEAELSFTIINPDTPEKVKRNIFKRINTGGMRLSAQEIRHALYQGEATDLLKSLVNSSEYKSVIGETVKDNRMAGRELIIRYLSFNLRGWRSFKGDMDSFLSDTMRWINGDITLEKIKPYDQGQISSTFEMALSRNKKLFGDHAFRRSRADQRRTPVNKSLFEIWMYCFSRISSDFFEAIISRKKEFHIKYHDLLDYDDEFIDSIGRHGGDLIGVKNRYTKIVELLTEFKPSDD
ncbi:GmrSD restriction endonuclease domain-containing protein [Burkholderia ambifaria]|uniref:GmrSD restriction endonuclease domain-containing protein n=1 Tax=Burkholderia ambifaria TaxID=152480 RepID=UPI001A9C3C81